MALSDLSYAPQKLRSRLVAKRSRKNLLMGLWIEAHFLAVSFIAAIHVSTSTRVKCSGSPPIAMRQASNAISRHHIFGSHVLPFHSKCSATVIYNHRHAIEAEINSAAT